MLLLSRFKISGHSMEPLIKFDEFVLASSLPYVFKNPQKGDIIVFKDKTRKTLIKRIIRIKGENYFVLGDNRRDSLDSRKFGWILRREILGKIIAKL